MTNETGIEALAAQIAGLVKGGEVTTIATAESLTGGNISCLLAAAPDSAGWFRGSIVAYSSDVKYGLLEVPSGPVVSAAAAHAMAASTAKLLDADVTVAVTGVGGPDPQDGIAPGTVWFGLAVNGTVRAEVQHFRGEPDEIVELTTRHALELVIGALRAR